MTRNHLFVSCSELWKIINSEDFIPKLIGCLWLSLVVIGDFTLLIERNKLMEAFEVFILIQL